MPIKYIGSKRLLIPKIVEIIKNETADVPLGWRPRVLDLFSGTSRVGYALQNEGMSVVANDINTYAYYIAKTYVQFSGQYRDYLVRAIHELNEAGNDESIEIDGWFTKTYCEDSWFFQPKNGIKIERIRNRIEEWYKGSIHYHPLIVSLIEAADRVDSTCGLQMAYLKQWAPRSNKDLELRIPDFSSGIGTAIQMDAKEAASTRADLAYIDPPYNQHNYLGNYHIWETLCLWDKPETYGKAQKRIDVKTKKSNFNSKVKIYNEFKEVINNLSAPKALISFNDEGYLSRDQISEILEFKFKTVEVIEVPYKRYIGAKIGIHNKQGEKVGKVSHTKNKELLFMAK